MVQDESRVHAERAVAGKKETISIERKTSKRYKSLSGRLWSMRTRCCPQERKIMFGTVRRS